MDGIPIDDLISQLQEIRAQRGNVLVKVELPEYYEGDISTANKVEFFEHNQLVMFRA